MFALPIFLSSDISIKEFLPFEIQQIIIVVVVVIIVVVFVVVVVIIIIVVVFRISINRFDTFFLSLPLSLSFV